MNRTKIEWVKNPDGTPGYTWNPITGCLNHTNGLCKGGGFPCYAYRLANGRLKQRYLANTNWDTHTPEGYDGYPNLDPFYPRFWAERCHGDLYTDSYPKHGKSKGIFVCDMSDLFGIGIPEEWTAKVMTEIMLYPWHRFYLLTKQPQNLIKFSPFPDNCWVGVTITNEATLLKGTTNLGYIDAKVKFISFEPLLERLPLPYYQMNCDWVIIGAQTKPYKPPQIEWVEEIVRAANKAGIPVFLKDNLLELVNYQSPETEFAFNEEGFYRQEIPK